MLLPVGTYRPASCVLGMLQEGEVVPVRLEIDGTSRVVQFCFSPDLRIYDSADESAVDAVLLVDRSGSMSGEGCLDS